MFVWFAGLMRRLADFRTVNTEDETVLNYFDELEIHPDHVGEFNKVFFVKTEISRALKTCAVDKNW